MKNTMSFIIGLLLLFSTLFSCQSYVDKTVTYTTDLSKPKSHLSLSSFVKDIHSVKLQLTPPYFFGVVDEVVLRNNNYFVVDKRQNIVFRFTKDGTFLNTIGKRGQGPGEYAYMSNFFTNDSIAFVCDIGARTIYKFSFDGEFLKTVKIPHSLVFDDITVLPNGHFLCHRLSDDENGRGIWTMDQFGGKKKTIIEYKGGSPYMHSDWNTLYTNSDGQIQAYNPADGSYYQINSTDDTAVKTMRLNCNRKMLVDLECSNSEMLNTKEKCAYCPFTIDGENYILSLWFMFPENQVAWTICRKIDGKVDIGALLKLDIPGYSEIGRPVSSNIPNTLVTIYTDEFPKEKFPDAYKSMELNEETAVLSLLMLK